MKNALISGLIGLLFLAGGFGVGFKMMPQPKPVAATPATSMTVTPPGAAVPMPTPDAISMDTLKKTSQSMMDLNLALADREKRVTEREARVQQAEDQLAAERIALDASHEKFKALFNDFQSRLQLVEANQQEQLQKQADLYNAMGPDQSIELLRSMDDDTLTRLFSVMDTKPLAKIVGSWKTKYPADSSRLLRTLSNTGEVIDKDKVAMSDPLNTPSDAGNATTPVAAPAPDATPAPSSGSSAPAPSTDATTPPAPEAAPTPSTDTTTPAPDATPAPAPDSTAPAAPQPLAPPPDVPAPKAPAQSSKPVTTDAVEPDATTPGATAEALENIPVAQPAKPSDLGVTATDLQPRRAEPVNITSTTSN